MHLRRYDLAAKEIQQLYNAANALSGIRQAEDNEILDTVIETQHLLQKTVSIFIVALSFTSCILPCCYHTILQDCGTLWFRESVWSHAKHAEITATIVKATS
jgi:hypothetical protein